VNIQISMLSDAKAEIVDDIEYEDVDVES
jgi:hypothetical protein